MSSTILVPTDLSPSSLPALELAILLAPLIDAQVTLLYVVDNRQLMPIPLPVDVDPDHIRHEMLKQAYEALQTLADERRQGVVLTCHVRLGRPEDEILAEAEQISADMILMTTHGRSGLAHLVMGSVAERLLRGARCPVLTLRSGGPLHKVKRAPEQNGALARPPVELPRRILVGVDLSSASLPALQHAGWLATHLGAEVTVQHVVDITYSTLPYLMGAGTGVDLHEQLIVRAGDALSEFLQQNASVLPPVILNAATTLRMGDAARELELTAEELAAGLVVIGSHGRRGFRRWLMGSVAEQVVRVSPCPVCVVPTPLPLES